VRAPQETNSHDEYGDDNDDDVKVEDEATQQIKFIRSFIRFKL
jgi:hypothetical protein